jgi:hypothetical protein
VVVELGVDHRKSVLFPASRRAFVGAEYRPTYSYSDFLCQMYILSVLGTRVRDCSTVFDQATRLKTRKLHGIQICYLFRVIFPIYPGGLNPTNNERNKFGTYVRVRVF